MITEMNKQDREHIEKVAEMLCMRSSELGRECIEVMLETIYYKGGSYSLTRLRRDTDIENREGI